MRALIALAAACLPLLGHAQHWRALGVGPLFSAINKIMADTVVDRLLAAGDFNFYINDDDTVRCAGVGQWRGARWDSIAHRIVNTESNGAVTAYWPLRFQGALYLCGAGLVVDDPAGNPHLGFARLNEQTMRWETFGCTAPTESSLLFVTPRETAGQNYIYVSGTEWPLCGGPIASVYRWNGTTMTTWTPWLQLPEPTGNTVNYVFEYQGKVYVCGSMNNPFGPGGRTILRYNGTNWEDVPGYLGGLVADISIYRDTLYVAGQFQGNSGNGLCKGVGAFYNDQWYPLGEGLVFEPSPSVSSGHSLRWFNDELYLGGGFSLAGGIPANGLAKWNRRQWCSLPGFDATSFDSGYRVVRSMAVWRDSLYVSGSFNTLEGIPMRGVVQWIGGDAVTDCSSPVGLHEMRADQNLSVSPNPTTGIFRIQNIPTLAARLELRDGLGRPALSEKAGSGQIDISALPSGLYHLLVLDKEGVLLARGPLIKR